MPRWPIVGAAMVGMSTGPSQYAFGSLALFIGPISAEFGWTRTQISFASTCFTIALLFSLPVAGRLVDLFGSRRLLLPSMFIVAALLSAIPVSVSAPWHLWVIFGLIGGLGAGANALPYMRTVSAWFDKRRGLAIGATLAGAGLGYTYVPPLLRFTIDNYGWRPSYWLLAALTVCIAMPVVFFFFREAPESVEPSASQIGEPEKNATEDVTRHVALRSWTFWNMFTIFGLLSFSLYGLLVHSVSLLEDRGMTAAAAAYGASVIGITIILSRIVIGYLCDRYFAPRVAAAAFAVSALGLAMLAAGSTGAAAYFALTLIGFSIGAEIDMMTFLTTRYFGIAHFGEIYGILFASLLIGTSLGPLLFGWSFESTGSYVSILWAAAAFAVVATIMCLALPPYKQLRGDPE